MTLVLVFAAVAIVSATLFFVFGRKPGSNFKHTVNDHLPPGRAQAQLVMARVGHRNTVLYRHNNRFYSLNGYLIDEIFDSILFLNVIADNVFFDVFEGTCFTDDIYYIENDQLVNDMGEVFNTAYMPVELCTFIDSGVVENTGEPAVYDPDVSFDVGSSATSPEIPSLMDSSPVSVEPAYEPPAPVYEPPAPAYEPPTSSYESSYSSSSSSYDSGGSSYDSGGGGGYD